MGVVGFDKFDNRPESPAAAATDASTKNAAAARASSDGIGMASLR